MDELHIQEYMATEIGLRGHKEKKTQSFGPEVRQVGLDLGGS